MKTLKIITLTISLLICATILVSAQKSNYSKIKSYLDKADIKYRITEEDGFRIVFDMGNDRSQEVYIGSKPSQVDGMEIFEILSAAQVINKNTDFSKQMCIELLTENNMLKIGNWQLGGDEQVLGLFYSIKFISSISRTEFLKLILIASEVADDKEKEFSEEDIY